MYPQPTHQGHPGRWRQPTSHLCFRRKLHTTSPVTLLAALLFRTGGSIHTHRHRGLWVSLVDRPSSFEHPDALLLAAPLAITTASVAYSPYQEAQEEVVAVGGAVQSRDRSPFEASQRRVSPSRGQVVKSPQLQLAGPGVTELPGAALKRRKLQVPGGVRRRKRGAR